jgi:site-specific DNA-adenine methylase
MFNSQFNKTQDNTNDFPSPDKEEEKVSTVRTHRSKNLRIGDTNVREVRTENVTKLNFVYLDPYTTPVSP